MAANAVPKTGERKLMQERKEKAWELADKLAKAREQLPDLFCFLTKRMVLRICLQDRDVQLGNREEKK